MFFFDKGLDCIQEYSNVISVLMVLSDRVPGLAITDYLRTLLAFSRKRKLLVP